MEWLEQLPPHLRPQLDKARALEAFRQEIGAPHEPFAFRIAGSAWAIRHTQDVCWNQLVVSMPHASERERIEQLYEQRKAVAAAGMGMEYPPLPATCDTFDEFCRFLAEFEGQFAAPDPLGWGSRIDEILGYVV